MDDDSISGTTEIIKKNSSIKSVGRSRTGYKLTTDGEISMLEINANMLEIVSYKVKLS